jgi:hypothetical protein
MNPALIWIDILVVAFVYATYLLNQKGSPNIPSSSYYLDGRGPRK